MWRSLVLAVLVLLPVVSLWAQNDETAGPARRSATEWRDIEVYEQNRLYPRTNVVPYDDENGIEKLDYRQSSSYVVLDEGWHVDYTEDFADRVSEIESKDFSGSGWAEITLPDVRWVKGGKSLRVPQVGRGAQIGEKGNATATYYNEFDVPKDWSGYDVFLQLQPLSACYVWVNRAYVGYVEDSRSLAEFDISRHLQPGKRNTLTLQLVSLSTSNLMEMNRDPRHLGFASEVALLLKGAVNVQDYAIRASYGDGKGRFAIDLNVANRNRKGRYYVEVELWNPIGRQAEKMGRWIAFDKRSEVPVSIEREIVGAQPWCAESPALYTAVIRLLDEKMNLVESVGTRFGFRSVEVEGGLLKVNGEAVTLRGVIYGDYTFDDDGVVDYDLVEEELKRMKACNVNAIRTAIYSPADVRFYEMCDRLGFYVVCDANLHPYSTQSKAIATDNAYGELFVSRVQNMYEQFKNHTSIIAWSLGESGDNGSCMTTAYKQLKLKDRTRPVAFAGAGYGENTDLIAMQRATAEQVRQYLGRMQSRPLLLFSYGSAEGNSLGGLDALWQLVENNANVQGGFFANWNETLYREVENGRERRASGLRGRDGSENPGLRQLAYMYRPFDVSLRSFSPDAGEFAIDNRTEFLSAQDYSLEYNIYTTLKPTIISGDVPQLPVAGSSKVFKLMIPKLKLYAGEEMFIRFTLKTKQASASLAKGAELYSEQFRIPMEAVARQAVSFETCGPLRVEEQRSNDSVKILTSIMVAGDNTATTIDMTTGEIVSYKFRGEELLKSPLRLNFWRLPTDNDLAERSVARQWVQLGPDRLRRELTDIEYRKVDDWTVAVDMMIRYLGSGGGTLMDVRQTLLLLATGDIVMSTDLMATEALHSLPRVGLQTRVAKGLRQVNWMGTDGESYEDRKGGMRIGNHKADAAELYHRYARPQEAGERVDVRWLDLRDGTKGLFFNMPDTLFLFSLYPYEDRALARGRSYQSLSETDGWTLNLDCRQSGIGSALSGIDIAAKNLIEDRKIHFVTHFSAYDPTEYDPFDFCRVDYPVASSNVLEMPSIVRDRERFDGPLTITLKSPDKGATIRYTLDGSDPSASATLYDKPFVIENSTVIKARAFREGDAPSFTAVLRCDYAYITSVAYDKKPNTPYNHNSALALFDGEQGDVDDLSQGWIGFSGGDLGATFRLARPIDVEEVSMGFAHNPEAWIFAPQQVMVYLSYDGQTFADSAAAVVDYRPADPAFGDPAVYRLTVKAAGQAVKAVRVVAKGIGRIPDWHRAKGLKPWLMIDEVTVRERME